MGSRNWRNGAAIAVLLLMGVAGSGWAEGMGGKPAGKITRTVYFAWYDGNGAYFTLEGFSSVSLALANGTLYVPRLGKASEQGDQSLFIFQNGAAGQQDIIDGVPSDPKYSPVMHVLGLTWRIGVTPVLLTSYRRVYEEYQAGHLLVYDTGARLNGAVVWQNTDLNGFGGRRAPTLLQDVQFIGLRPRYNGQQGQVELPVYLCYFNGNRLAFADLDHGDGKVPNQSGEIIQLTAVPRLGLPVMGEAAVATLYGVEGQDAVISTAPDQPDYTPLWHIVFVRRKRGFTTLLTSEQAILAAQAAGNVTLESAGDYAVFNCPIVDLRLVQPVRP
jgi:hypothetical protein